MPAKRVANANMPAMRSKHVTRLASVEEADVAGNADDDPAVNADFDPDPDFDYDPGRDAVVDDVRM
jgi:hypothetical protein